MRKRASDRPPSTARSAVHQAVVRFVAWSLLALVVLTIGIALVSNQLADHEAQRDAQSRGRGIAAGVAAPMVNTKVRSGDPVAIAALAKALQNRMIDGAASHMKIWDSSGRVIWSDETELTGRQFPLPRKIQKLFGTRDVAATFTSPHEEDKENTAEGPFYEVYVGAFDADHQPMVFETYISPARINEDESAILLELLPLGLGALVLSQLALLPLSISLARRVQRSQEERAKLLRTALMSSDLERRRISQEMHDVVLQKLAAIGYALPLVADGLSTGPEGRCARSTLDTTESLLRESVHSLRAVLADIYPPELRSPEDLRAALQGLVDGAAQSGVVIALDVADNLSMERDAAQLVYRIVREAVRNVVSHAQATYARVSVMARGDSIDVRVEDDGRGVSATAKPGHFGVRLLSDAVQEVGGDLELRSGDRGGAVLEATFPAALV